MKWVNFLHFYQPANQHRDILEAVVSQCYRPVLKGLLGKSNAKLTINVSGSLLELLDKYGFKDVIDYLKTLYHSKKIELTSTACYHAFLPLLSEKEIKRQIELNNDVLKKYLGSEIVLNGFFPPEMGINNKLMNVLCNSNYKYVILDSIAYKGPLERIEAINGLKMFYYKTTDLKIFFRDRRTSNIIMSGIERGSKQIYDLLSEYSQRFYLITAMDGETFGHHRPGLEESLLDLYDEKYDKYIDDKNIQFSTISDIMSLPIEEDRVEIQDSTWASSPQDISNQIQFISWNDPENIIHKYQWQLTNLMLEVLEKSKEYENYESMRQKADKALASDQFFWASAKPWWSVEMIEAGAHQCVEVIEMASEDFKSQKETARELYLKIVSTAFEWQRSGKIREMNRQRNIAQRIPFKERTLEAGGEEAGVYYAFIHLMKKQEKLSAAKGEYEKAILWRDAVHKIETKNDIYDAIHAVDLLRLEIPNEQIEKLLQQYKEKYKKLRGGQPEQRSN